VHDLVQIVRASLCGRISPQAVDDLLAMQAMSGREREQFYERFGFTQTPAVGYRLLIDHNGEATQ
jgi:hypothetical protein